MKTFNEDFVDHFKSHANKDACMIRMETTSGKPILGQVIEVGLDYVVMIFPDKKPHKINLINIVEWQDVSDSSGHQERFGG